MFVDSQYSRRALETFSYLQRFDLFLLLLTNKGKRIDISQLVDLKEDVFVTTSKNGWIDESIKEQWLDAILPGLDRTKRHIFICDGHTTNLSLGLLKKAAANNIDILAFPSHSTTLLQPLDVIPFKQLKKSWKEVVHRFIQTHTKLGKGDFLRLVRGPLHHAHNPLYIERAFTITGIYPLDEVKLKEFNSVLTPEQQKIAIKNILSVPQTIPFQKKSIKKYLTTNGKLLTASSVIQLLKEEKKMKEEEKEEKKRRQKIKKEEQEKKKIEKEKKALIREQKQKTKLQLKKRLQERKVSKRVSKKQRTS